MKGRKLNLQLIIGGILVIIILLMAFLGPKLSFVEHNLNNRAWATIGEGGKITKPPLPPSKEYLLGTDDFGIDLLSKIIAGAKEVIVFIFSITLIRFAIAIPLGFLSYYIRPVDYLMNIWNKAFSYIPIIFYVLIIFYIPYIHYAPNRMEYLLYLIALLEVGRVALTYKSSIETISTKPFITTAISNGTSQLNIFRKYYLPFTTAELIVQMIIDFARNMFLLGQLAIIGIYVSHNARWIMGRNFEYNPVLHQDFENAHSWTLFFRDIGSTIHFTPWVPLVACVAITLIVVSFFIFAEGLRKFFNKQQVYL